MKITHAFLITALTAVTTPYAFADSSSTPYVGAEIGVVQLTNSFSNIFSLITGMDERVFAGTLWGEGALKYGVEGSVMYFNDASLEDPFGFGDRVDFRGYAFSALGVVKYNFDSGFSLSAKAGPAYLHQQASSNGMSVSHGQICPEVALGLGYRFNPQWEAQLTADTILANESGSNPVYQTKSLNVGLTYHFA